MIVWLLHLTNARAHFTRFSTVRAGAPSRRLATDTSDASVIRSLLRLDFRAHIQYTRIACIQAAENVEVMMQLLMLLLR